MLADVLETRRSPRSSDDAVAVWEKLREEREILGADVAEISGLLLDLERLLPTLRLGDGVDDAGRIALEISEACRRLK